MNTFEKTVILSRTTQQPAKKEKQPSPDSVRGCAHPGSSCPAVSARPRARGTRRVHDVPSCMAAAPWGQATGQGPSCGDSTSGTDCIAPLGNRKAFYGKKMYYYCYYYCCYYYYYSYYKAAVIPSTDRGDNVKHKSKP